MIVELSPLHSRISNFKIEHFTFYETSDNVVRIEAVVFTDLTKVTWRNFHCR